MIFEFGVALGFGAVSMIMLSISLGLILGDRQRRRDWFDDHWIRGTSYFWIA